MIEPVLSSYSTLCPVVIGRGRYIEVLRQVCEQSRLGQGQTLILAGEAGIGKSRLAAEAVGIAAQAGFTVLQTACFEAECAIPYAPLLALLRRQLAGKQRLAELWAPFAAPLVALMPDLQPHWPEVRPAGGDEASAARAAQFEGLAGALTSAGSPLLLVIEDVHESDEASLQFLLVFARQLVGRPILLLLTYRTDEARPALQPLLAELERTRLAVELKPTRLPRADVTFMARVIFQQARPAMPQLIQAIHSLSGGNPLFVEEALKTLVAGGEVYRAADGWTHKPIAEIQLPSTVQAAVQRRLASLSARAQELLSLAAVAFRPLDEPLARTLLAAGAAEWAALTQELSAAQLIRRDATGAIAPRHVLLRQAIYSGLLARERQGLHSRMLAALADQDADEQAPRLGEMVEHAFQAGQWEEAMTLARRAAERALALGWPRAAVESFGRALEAARRLGRPAPPDLYHARGQAHERLNEFDAARLDYEQAGSAARLARDGRAEWRSFVDLGFLWQGRDAAQSNRYFEQAFEQAYAWNDPVLLSLGRASGSMAAGPAPASRQPAVGDQRALATTLDLLGAASFLAGDVISGTRYLRQAVALFRELAEARGLTASLSHLALSATLDLESPDVGLGEAVRYGEEALAVARANGWRAEQTQVLSELASGYGRQGEYARALELSQQALALATEPEAAALRAYALAAQGAVYVDVYAAEQARPLLREALTLAEGIPSRYMACHAARLAALALLEGGAQAGEIAALLDRAERVVEPEAPAGRGKTLADRALAAARAQLALAGGDAASALALVNGMMARTAEDDGAPPAPAGVTLLLLRGEALSALRQPAKAEADLRLAQRMAVEQGALPSLWRVHAALGKHYLRFKQRAPANTEFEQARAFIQGLAERIPQPELREQFLHQTRHLAPPAAPPPPRASGAREQGGLTERERETVALIAEGKSNREIAAHLVVSDETVKTHVSHILGKLGLRSRTQIAAWAIRHGLTSKG